MTVHRCIVVALLGCRFGEARHRARAWRLDRVALVLGNGAKPRAHLFEVA